MASKWGYQLTQKADADLDDIVGYIAVELANPKAATDFVDKDSEVRDVKVSYGDGIDYANLKPANGFTRLWPVDISVNDVEKNITV